MPIKYRCTLRKLVIGTLEEVVHSTETFDFQIIFDPNRNFSALAFLRSSKNGRRFQTAQKVVLTPVMSPTVFRSTLKSEQQIIVQHRAHIKMMLQRSKKGS